MIIIQNHTFLPLEWISKLRLLMSMERQPRFATHTHTHTHTQTHYIDIHTHTHTHAHARPHTFSSYQNKKYSFLFIILLLSYSCKFGILVDKRGLELLLRVIIEVINFFLFFFFLSFLSFLFFFSFYFALFFPPFNHLIFQVHMVFLCVLIWLIVSLIVMSSNGCKKLMFVI